MGFERWGKGRGAWGKMLTEGVKNRIKKKGKGDLLSLFLLFPIYSIVLLSKTEMRTLAAICQRYAIFKIYF